MLTNSPRTRAPEGSAWTVPASSLLGTTALRPLSRTPPRRPPRRCYAPSWPRLRPGRSATRLGGAGDRVPRQPVHRPQPQVLPGTNPSPHVEPPLSPECMTDRAYRGCAGGRLMAVPNGNIRPGGWRCCFAILVVLKGPRNHARTSWPTSRCRWSGNACTRANREAGRGRVPPDDDVQLRQLLLEFHPVSHEAHEGQGRSHGGLQAHS